MTNLATAILALSQDRRMIVGLNRQLNLRDMKNVVALRD